ncbi:hypothetical protein [Sphingomonas immobilis]|uniref:GIY-YIG domain-containing protein n=1 Tax=Sphingomonas immobilis TaxID=3063997 RepID=A0ABT8ZU39_9SPHN|nr:hypothetical protein [Sphingomonas sp. CA1-15]MDO7841093.1 hypothetical protein [Sphingomonas sp. CA1-15]
MTYGIPDPCAPVRIGEFMMEDSRFPAVYFLYRYGELVYVGQSTTLKFRIETHLTEGVKIFDSVAYIRCTLDRLVLIESHYIRLHAPRYNDCAIAKKAKERLSWKTNSGRRGAVGSKFEAGPDEDLSNLQFVDAAEMMIPLSDLGEFLHVGESDAAEFRKKGNVADNSVLGLINWVSRNSKRVSEAQQRFENL